MEINKRMKNYCMRQHGAPAETEALEFIATPQHGPTIGAVIW